MPLIWVNSQVNTLHGHSIFPAMPPEFKSITEETQYGVLGKTAKVSLAVRGFPLPVIEWIYKGDNLCDMKKYKSFISPSGVITLEIFDFCMTDVGEYKCRAENDHGYKSIIIQLEYAGECDCK
jgi:hypothetical protein